MTPTEVYVNFWLQLYMQKRCKIQNNNLLCNWIYPTLRYQHRIMYHVYITYPNLTPDLHPKYKTCLQMFFSLMRYNHIYCTHNIQGLVLSWPLKRCQVQLVHSVWRGWQNWVIFIRHRTEENVPKEAGTILTCPIRNKMFFAKRFATVCLNE
jgi:hypothetical protein